VLDLAIPLAALLPKSAGPYIAITMAGFAIGILGHLTGARWLIGAGVALICLGALLLPVALNLTEETPPQIENPR
jgi:hypothetical protein